MELKDALTFDDCLLQPAYSNILPHECDISTFLTPKIRLNIPLLSAAMDTVTESKMAIAIAQVGGIGVIHKNLTIEEQAQEVRIVKRYESGMVRNPITIHPDMNLEQALNVMQQHKIQGLPVIDPNNQKLVGILTHRDVRFCEDKQVKISDLMTKNLVTVQEGVSHEEAKKLLHQHRIEKLPVVNDDGICVGLITVKDMEKSANFPHATKDEDGRLRVAAAIGTSDMERDRAHALISEGCDVITVDTAHGHSQKVLDQVAWLRQNYPDISIIGGNIATKEAAIALIDHGVDTVKIGIGPGSICTTRMIAGVGVPQLSAIWEVSEICAKHNIMAIADGGIKYSGDLAKAIAAGADCVMIGSLFAGSHEAPGETFLYQGRSYKAYRGMGSAGAMVKGSADRYFQNQHEEAKFVPEGVEGRVPYKGEISEIIHQLLGGLRASMGYTGNGTIADMKKGCALRKITPAGLRESHVHDVTVTKEPPNYKLQ
jgi:IMP dehydrogenase